MKRQGRQPEGAASVTACGEKEAARDAAATAMPSTPRFGVAVGVLETGVAISVVYLGIIDPANDVTDLQPLAAGSTTAAEVYGMCQA